jgi:hypothetical protein
MGQVLQNPRERVKGTARREGQLRWYYPGHLSMQCITVYGRESGLYLACNDTAAFRKNFVMKGDVELGLHFEIEHLPERGEGSNEWSMPYEVICGPLPEEGGGDDLHRDWLTAAEIYRSWATNQAWAKESRLTRDLVPEWVRKTSLWVWNRGHSDSVLSPALELQKRMDLPVSVFWHWWHGCSYDAGFPEYFPPREGTERFKRQMKLAQKHDVRALVYMNQRLWGMSTPSWRDEGAAAYAVKDAQGAIRPEIYNTFTRAECASMCMGTEFWRNKYAGLAARAVQELGVDGIYMDQACTSLACYDPEHPHPPGGGTYWVEGFRLMQQDIRDRCRPTGGRSPTTGLAGEGTGEAWLPYLDLMLSLQVSKERYAGPDGWEPVPFFHAVYHPYVVSYGNYSSLTMPPYDDLWPIETAPKEPLQLLDRKFSRQFYLEQARAFVWGQQPTIANFLPKLFDERKAEIDFVVRLARLRERTTPYLQYGTFLRPPKVTTSSSRIDMSRLSIYAGQHGGVREFDKEVSDALAAAWRSPDGKLGIALASISEEPIEVTLTIDKDRYGIADGARIARIDEAGRNEMGKLKDNNVKVRLPSLGACVLEFGD